MISFADQAALWLLIPLVIGMWSFGRTQRRALAWIERHVSSRHRRGFSVHSRASLRRHLAMLTVLGALLVAAGAGPSRPGKAEATATDGRVLFLIDASASMFADDVAPIFAEREHPAHRLEIARRIALDLVSKLGGYRFALASYSGSGVVHLPITTNHTLLEDALEALENHNYYKNTGSDLSAALDVVSHFTDPDAGRLQVVMLGDGELPRDLPFDRALHALPPQGIVVHSITIGSREGQSRVIYDFRDIIAKKENPTVLREYTTRRVDRHLKRIASRTGGFFSVAESGVSLRLAERIRTTAEAGHEVVHEQARRDLAPWLLAAALLGFLFDALILGHQRRPTPTFELDRLGEKPGGMRAVTSGRASSVTLLAVALLLTSCSDSPRKRAHYENESGIGHDAFRRHDKARPHYERSRGYRIEPEIPTHNLARSAALVGDVSEAHDLFQEALTLEPELAEALFNDGVTLYLWGQAERDPENCDLERTRDLWGQAAARFASTTGMSSAKDELASQSRANHRFLSEALAEIEQLIADPPDHCVSEPKAGDGEQEQESSSQQEEENESGSGDENEQQSSGAGDEQEDQSGHYQPHHRNSIDDLVMPDTRARVDESLKKKPGAD